MKGKNGVHVVCPNCGWSNKNKSTKCLNCGAELHCSNGKNGRKKRSKKTP